LSGIGRSNGTLRNAFVSAGDDGAFVGATLGQVRVGSGFGASAVAGALPLLQPTTADSTAPVRAVAATFTPPPYVTAPSRVGGNDTIWW